MIRLDGRLSCALSMLEGAVCVADIGCDHGKLTAALLERGVCERVIAGDLSPDCLNKTRTLIERLGLGDRAAVRLGSGFEILAPQECDAAAILGMGGELMAELLSAAPKVAQAMERIVLQPMSGIEELRRWLYENRYQIITDRIAAVGSRAYQLLCVRKGAQADPWPKGFPEDCFLVGYRSLQEHDPLLGTYCARQLEKRCARIKQAAGTAGEAKLRREAEQLEAILKEIQAWN